MRTPWLAVLWCWIFAAFACAQDDTPYPLAPSKKGLQVQMVEDALALGIHHAGLNVDLVRLSLPGRADGAIEFAIDGETYWFAKDYVEALDAQIAPLSERGVLVSLILLAIQSGDAVRDRSLVHPAVKERAPNGMTAFDTETKEGKAKLRAAVAFAAARWCSAKAPHGRVWNWIVGNEINSHWWWYHMGRRRMDEIVAAYSDAVRIVHAAVRRSSAHARVFVSMEHHWTIRYAAGDELQAFPGRDFLAAFAARMRSQGDIDWHLAFHPYPENLFECRFWRDQTAPDRDDAPRVTFRNLDVLRRFLARDELRYQRAPRRVILSEQGFHCRADADGERDQAAAFALAWHIIQAQEGIDAMLLHRHVDHAHEGGLLLGLWSRADGSICTPDRRRKIYEVFRDCDTDRWPGVADFALPVVGLERWSDWPARAK